MKHQCIHKNAFYFYIGNVLNQFEPEKKTSFSCCIIDISCVLFCLGFSAVVYFMFLVWFGVFRSIGKSIQ